MKNSSRELKDISMPAEKADFHYNNSLTWKQNASAAKRWMKGWLNISERDPAVFGPKFWKMLHVMCSQFPEAEDMKNGDEEVASNFIYDFLNNIPCASCRNDFGLILSRLPSPPLKYAKFGKTSLFFLSYMLHNYVTEKVYPGRPMPKFTEVCAQYNVNPDKLPERPKSILKEIGLW